MTPMTRARIAGFTFLFYIAVAFPSMVLMGRATGTGTLPETLARIAAHAGDVRLAVVLTFLSCFSAIILAVALHGMTRHVDQDLAMLVMACRLGEGVLGAVGIPTTLGLLWLATATGTAAPDGPSASALASLFLMPPQNTMTGAPFFAVGSLAFSYLLWRGRLVPTALAWLGLIASALLVVVLPLQIAGFLAGASAAYVWLPMLAFEVPLGVWLLVKAVPAPAGR